MRTLPLSLALFLSLPLPARAANFPGARELSMGGTSAAGVSAETAAFLNPSALSGVPGPRTAFSQAKLLPDTLTFQFSSAFPVKPELGLGFGWGALVARDQVQRELVRDANGQLVVDPLTGLPLTRLVGFFSRNDNTGTLSLGAGLGPLSFGISGKYLFTKFGGRQGQGFGMDLGGRYSIGKGLVLGAALMDLGDTRLDFKGEEFDEKIRGSMAAGLELKGEAGRDFTLRAEPALGRALGGGGKALWSAGLEAGYRDSLFFRGGLNRDRLSFGVGLATRPEKLFKEVRLDYAYLARVGPGFPSRLTLVVGW